MDAVAPCQAEISVEPALSMLRFSLSEADLSGLDANAALALPRPRALRIQDRFFDTADFALARHGITLRVRKAGRTKNMTLCNGTEQLNATLTGPQPDLTTLPPDWQATLAPLLDSAALEEKAGASFKQAKRRLDGAELSFETGHLLTGAQKIPFSELELAAPAAILPDTALRLATHCTLLAQTETLGQRALRLAGAPAPAVQKAAPGLNGTPCLDEAVDHIIRACLTQFRANIPVFFEGNEIGAVHQMRVSMRRLRSALGLFNRALPTPDFISLRDEAKRIANAMGDARNWDVFITMLQNGPAAAFPDEVGFAALEAQCASHRQAGYQQVHALLEDPATTRFLLTAEAFVARRGWRGGLPTELLPRLAEPAKSFGAECLERLQRKVRKHGKHLARLPAHDRHLVRIELKKLRYTAEFFGSLFEPRGRVRGFNRAAAALQEELGKLNDMATAERLAAKLHGGSVEAQRALGIVLGWTAHAALGEPHALTATWKAFQDAKLFN
ncbi:CYTH and CHAD domain-containing protein [Acidocella aminolytica]|jgi:inorganic triphosphatase YgiF|uniref:CHAD domain-containing protein n=1 Tax=Acidocella aminolytica 101 = DSM 11237 TaxID=1120923 RepID=A0A0D6PI66_9PROT|nr:CHAD domain-containing protein [Acidocella aminolytica]GAN80519.1 hypothetical protein Aam_049_021 [Acidocella aminolytica 101 = DSM 11237]GBQ37792.1 hypothetical protein AA11237_1643 [Acidocella aminolytica 101 = DSM 11237]SHF39775.1 Inorganic triphosphatase YgiF, contains CYTH and CHAD domains [Acidocella aminolytica 101 = DSM 11237]